PRAHRGDVAQPARQALMAHSLRSMPAASKVHVLEREIPGDDDLFSVPPREHGCIIADANSQGIPATASAHGARANLRQNCPLTLAHIAPTAASAAACSTAARAPHLRSARHR